MRGRNSTEASPHIMATVFDITKFHLFSGTSMGKQMFQTYPLILLLVRCGEREIYKESTWKKKQRMGVWKLWYA